MDASTLDVLQLKHLGKSLIRPIAGPLGKCRMYVIGSETDPTLLMEEGARFGRLQRDFLMCGGCIVPSPTILEDAPVIDRWAIAYTAVPCLAGHVTGHPVLEGRDRRIATSQVWLISSDLEWARTHSRWYRLGRPAETPVNG